MMVLRVCMNVVEMHEFYASEVKLQDSKNVVKKFSKQRSDSIKYRNVQENLMNKRWCELQQLVCNGDLIYTLCVF